MHGETVKNIGYFMRKT